MEERAACALLKQRFEAAGFTIEENRPFDEDGIRFEIDGFDAQNRVGYEYATEEAGDSWDVDDAVIAALEERRKRSEVYILIVREADAPDAASLGIAADAFLAELRERGVGRVLSAEPVSAEPVSAEPVPAEPVSAEPVPAEPVPAEPVPAEPVPAEPVPAEAAHVEPVHVEPESAKTANAEPAQLEQAPVESAQTEAAGSSGKPRAKSRSEGGKPKASKAKPAAKPKAAKKKNPRK